MLCSTAKPFIENFIGIKGELLLWLRAFLTNRRQRVCIGKSYSKWTSVTSGVPQGSVLAPLLFIIYVNDMQSQINNVRILQFADDTKVFSAVQSVNDINQLQENLDLLSRWFENWRMSVNVKKCGILTFFTKNVNISYNLFGSKLNVSKSERDLGVIINESLSFKEHILTICNKAMRMYGWLTRTLATDDTKVIIRLYKALIRPILEYASTVWSPTRVGLIIKLESVQRKVTKFAFRRSSVLDYSERLRVSTLPSLMWRRLFLDLLMVHRILHGDIKIRKELFHLSTEVSSSNLRRHRLSIYKALFTCDIYKHHFVNRIVDEWNSLPHEVLDVENFVAFKKRLKIYLMTSKSPYAWKY